jgi:hypothetical protein
MNLMKSKIYYKNKKDEEEEEEKKRGHIRKKNCNVKKKISKK